MSEAPPRPQGATARWGRRAIAFDDLPTRVGIAVVLPDVLRDLGLDVEALFAAAGVDIARFANPEDQVTMAELARLVQFGVAASGRADLGLLVAERGRTRYVGLMGRLVASAYDLRGALSDLIRYVHLNSRGTVATLSADGDVAWVQLEYVGPDAGAGAVFDDASIGVVIGLIRSLLGGSWWPTAALLPHPRPRDPARYRRVFGAPVRFNACCAAIEFPAADLSRRLAHAPTERHLDVMSAAALASTEFGIAERVQWAIRAGLADGDVSLDHIARALGASRRTLNRRLAADGINFPQLLRTVRFASARQLLAKSAMPLSDIAASIGYAEQSVFSTAFRAWSGLSPGEWRRTRGIGAADPSPRDRRG